MGFTPLQTHFNDSCSVMMGGQAGVFASQFESLKNTIQNLRPELIRRVNAHLIQTVIQNPNCEKVPGPSVLRVNPVCGLASKHLGNLLKDQGVQVKQYITYRLPEGHLVRDHTFLTVSIEGRTVLIDPSFLYLFNNFSMSENHQFASRFLPEDDILVLPVDHLDYFLDDLYRVKEEIRKQAPIAETLKMHALFTLIREPRAIVLSESEFKKLYRSVWDMDADHYLEYLNSKLIRRKK
jgi:hypothetical protein